METVRSSRRWEIFLNPEDIDEFSGMLYDIDFQEITAKIMVSSSASPSGRVWVMCYPSDEFKVLAKIRFDIEEMSSFGTEIDFSG